jgi:Flp pilus assembly protein TadG
MNEEGWPHRQAVRSSAFFDFILHPSSFILPKEESPMFIRQHKARRRGAAVVEMAFVLPLALIFLFGIFEYGRYLMVLHTANNAAREGARFAAANTQLSSTTTAITDLVKAKMAGVDQQLQGYSVSVFKVDSSGVYSSGSGVYPPTIKAKSGSNWNDAQYGQGIAVQITGTYVPILAQIPTFDKINIPVFTASVSLTVTAMMNSEAN